MNDIIKEIEQEQLKDSVSDFAIGDTVKVYAKIKEGSKRNETEKTEAIGSSTAYCPDKIIRICRSKCRIRRGNILQSLQLLQLGEDYVS